MDSTRSWAEKIEEAVRGPENSGSDGGIDKIKTMMMTAMMVVHDDVVRAIRTEGVVEAVAAAGRVEEVVSNNSSSRSSSSSSTTDIGNKSKSHDRDASRPMVTRMRLITLVMTTHSSSSNTSRSSSSSRGGGSSSSSSSSSN